MEAFLLLLFVLLIVVSITNNHVLLHELSLTAGAKWFHPPHCLFPTKWSSP